MVQEVNKYADRRPVFEDSPGRVEAGKRAEKAVDVLHSAISHLHPPRNGEDWADVALRLRGADILARSAGLELAVVSGWNEAAHEAAASEMLDVEVRE